MSLRAGNRKVSVVMALALLAAALSMPARSAVTATAPSVNASIEPNQISVGESARLTILMSGRGTLSVTLPVVPGLEFRVVGQSRQIQIINGITLESTSTIVRVTPQEPGVFTIPGLTPNSPPLVLRVSPSGSRPPAPGTRRRAGSSAADSRRRRRERPAPDPRRLCLRALGNAQA